MVFTREITQHIRPQLENEYIIVLVGARQTGKTTLLRGMYADAKADNQPAFFINLERIDFVALLNQSPENIFTILPPLAQGEKTTVFIDEIQYLENPTNFLKHLYDEYKDRLKLVVTGSSAFYIDQKFKDSLAGRKRLFQLNTLSFREFLVFKQKEELAGLLPELFAPSSFTALESFPRIYHDELMRCFSEYARFGGYPQMVMATNEEEKRLVLEELVNSAVKKDILEARIRYPEPFFALFKILASQTGSLVNRTELATSLRVSLPAIDNYLYVIQKSFHAVLIRPFHTNTSRKELVKMPKCYFLDMGMRNYLINDFSDFNLRTDKGAFLENLVFKQLSRSFSPDDIQFWRTQDKHELDFVIQGQYGFEVKANPDSFHQARYSGFRTKHPDVPINVISYDRFEDKGTWRVWGAWGM